MVRVGDGKRFAGRWCGGALHIPLKPPKLWPVAMQRRILRHIAPLPTGESERHKGNGGVESARGYLERPSAPRDRRHPDRPGHRPLKLISSWSSGNALRTARGGASGVIASGVPSASALSNASVSAVAPVTWNASIA